MAISVRFDLYVRQNERWEQRERFDEDQHATALAMAERLDGNDNNEGVRIIRVTAFGANRQAVETLEWITPSLTKVAARSQIRDRLDRAEERVTALKKIANGPPVAAQEIKDEVSAVAKDEGSKARRPRNSPPKEKPAKRPSSGLWEKGIRVFIGGLTIGLLAVYPASWLVKRLVDSGWTFGPETEKILVFAIIVGAFVMAAILTAYAVLTSDGDVLTDAAASDKPQAIPVAADQEIELAAIPSTPPAPSETATETAEVSVPELEPEPEPEQVQGLDLDPGIGANTDEELEPAEPPSGIDLGFDVAPADENAPAPQLTEDHRRDMLLFLERTLTALTPHIETLDQTTIFGLNLFLGGAGERYGSHIGLRNIQKFVLIRESIGALGTSPDMVDLFCEKFFEYDADTKYRIMTDAGRDIMEMYLDDNHACFQQLPDIVKRWTSPPSARAQSQGIIVIMFTDLVDSTQLTHDRGDFGAQEVVRTHNAIVRNALAEYHGTEVKHTGDGIMASFAAAAAAASAAIRIQRNLTEHNAAGAELPLNVRIGLNAGDAVREEDDFFGHTVQLAARICNEAEAGQILVTSAVKDLCDGHAIEFRPMGEHKLKGIDEPTEAFEAVWRPEAEAAIEDEEELVDYLS